MGLRSFLAKWKPAAKCVIGCLLKFAGGAAAAADPANAMLYKVLTAGGEQASEFLFDNLTADQRRAIEDRFALFQPLLDQHEDLIRRMEVLAGRQDEALRSVEALSDWIRNGLPEELKPALEQFGQEVQGILKWLAGMEQRIMARFDRLERQPKSAFWVSIDDQEEVAWLRKLYEEIRSWPPEKRRQVRLEQFAGLLYHSGQHEAAGVVCAEAADVAPSPEAKAALFLRKMRSDLERGRLDDALASLRAAIALDPASAPFQAKKYEPLRVLGAGGFGVALLCRNLYEGGEVVVKCLYAEGLERKPQEIFREAPVLKQLHAAHPDLFLNVHYVSFADSQAERRPYLVMDYFPGITLTRLLNEKRQESQGVPMVPFRAIATQIALAMRAAHQRGILHRDLKPDNILVRRPEGRWEVRVIDFGLALRREVIAKSASTKAYQRALLGAAAAGTAKYAPPEQMGELNHPVGPWSDVYAFGKTCCEMLFRDLGPKRRHWQSLDDDLAELLEKCLEYQPKDRHQDFSPILAILQRQIGPPAEPGLKPRKVNDPPMKLDVGTRQVEPKKEPAKTKDERPAKVITNALKMKLVWIEPGRFQMGSPVGEKDRSDNEFQHDVEITRGFYLGAYEVTQDEYRQVMGKNPWYFNPAKVGGKSTDDFPVKQVSWDDAMEFCRLLTAKEKDTGRVYDLPTEAEWEYAARAGTRSVFASGDALDSNQGNFNGDYPYGGAAKGPYLGRTTSVGSYEANAWGLYDMHGNVFEWCQDWYGKDYYRDSGLKNPPGPATGTGRVLRGGSWHLYAGGCRSARRFDFSPGNLSDVIGFRVVVRLSPRTP